MCEQGKVKVEVPRKTVCRNKKNEKLQPESPSSRDKLLVPLPKKELHFPVSTRISNPLVM